MNLIIIILALTIIVLLCKAHDDTLQNQYESLTENRIQNARCNVFVYINKIEEELTNSSCEDTEYIRVVEQALCTLEKAKIVITTPDHQCSPRFITELEDTFAKIDHLLEIGKSRSRKVKTEV